METKGKFSCSKSSYTYTCLQRSGLYTGQSAFLAYSKGEATASFG